MNARIEKRYRVTMIPVGELFPSDTNPRKNFPADKAKELEKSIEASGLLEALVVRKHKEKEGFEIVAGERRWRAMKKLGVESVPCCLRRMTDLEVLRAQWSENSARANLNPVEEAEALLVIREKGVKRGELSEFVGKPRSWVQSRLELGELPGVAKKAVEDGKLGVGGARELLAVDVEEREAVTQEVLEFGDELTEERVRVLVRERYVKPRENRQKWRNYWETVLRKDWEDKAEPIEDVELWADCVQPFGEGRGKWKRGSEAIGGLAAKRSEAGVLWGDLAEAHGLKGLLVPAGGVIDDDFTNVITLVDGAAIQAAERAAREAGGEFTIGPRTAEKSEPEKSEPVKSVELEDDSAESGDKDAGESCGEKLEKSLLKSPVLEVGWNPWGVKRVLDAGEIGGGEAMMRARVALDVLDVEESNWRHRAAYELGGVDCSVEAVAEEFESWVPVLIWWVLRGPECPRLVRLAGLLGVLDFWRERRAL